MPPLAALALRILLALSPLFQPREELPGFRESPWERGVRYLAISLEVAGAVEEACAGREGCQRWALPALLGVAWHESGFAADVDAGTCWRGRDGRGPRCDGGKAATIFQMQGSAAERALWSSSRRQAAREALRRITRSLRACRRLPAAERLAAYASGGCAGEEPLRRARELHAAVERARAVR